MTCPHCSAINANDSVRCSRCGSVLSVCDYAETMGADARESGTDREPSKRPAAAAIASTPAFDANTPTLTAADLPGRPFAAGEARAIEPGSDFGPRYSIIALLGRGGMGAVYKAYDRELNREVALKVVRQDLTSQPHSMLRFKQELLLASRISHKNVLRIHDLGDVNGMKFISMAYIEGEDLQHLLKREGRLPLEQVLSIARQLCQALDAAHAEGVVHRDLKPQNILIGEGGQAYVSDFGLAKSLESDAATMTQTGVLLGTPQYMSPEQVEGGSVDHRSDIYALGLILYEMATGEAAFAGETAMQIMYLRLKQKPRDPREINADLPAYLGKIILRCLEKDPTKRYPSAHDVLLDLEGGREPAASRGSRTTQVTFTLPLGHRWWAAIAAVVAVIVLLMVIPPARHFVLSPFASRSGAARGLAVAGPGKFVAILPFRVLGDQASLQYIAEGLGDALTSKLFQLKNLHVASGDAVAKVNSSQPLSKLARDLGVNLVVSGTLQSGNGQIAIIVNLRDAVHDRLLWTEEFSGVPQDLLTLEDQIYNRLADVLEPRRGVDEQARASAHPTENFAAYELYLKGRDLMRGKPDTQKIQTALTNYNQALKLDPNFALAYAGIADASLEEYTKNKNRFWADKALSAAQQAERLNTNQPDVYSSLGNVYTATGKTSEAIIMLQRAVKLAPNSDDAYRRLGDAFLAEGRKSEALQAYQRAVQINPYYWNNHNELGWAYFETGDYGKALRSFQQVTRLEPDNSVGYQNVGAVYLMNGDYSKSIAAFQKALQLHPTYDTVSDLGTAYFYLRRFNDAVSAFEKAVAMNPNQAVVVANLADAYHWSRQPDKAKAAYDRAISLGVQDLQVNPRDSEAMGLLAVNYAKTGNESEAVQFIRRARSIDANNVDLVYDEAVIQARADNPSKALESLREALQKGFPVSGAANDPQLDSLWSNPGFKNLIKEFGGKQD